MYGARNRSVVRSLLQFALIGIALGSMLFFIWLFTSTQLQHLLGHAAVTIDSNALESEMVGLAVDLSHELGCGFGREIHRLGNRVIDTD